MKSCLTGRAPFCHEPRAEALRQVICKNPVAPRRLDQSIPKELEAICLQCLEKQVDQRYPSMAGLLDDLRCYLEGKPISATPVSWMKQRWRWCRQNPAATAITTAVAIALMAIMLRS